MLNLFHLRFLLCFPIISISGHKLSNSLMSRVMAQTDLKKRIPPHIGLQNLFHFLCTTQCFPTPQEVF